MLFLVHTYTVYIFFKFIFSITILFAYIIFRLILYPLSARIQSQLRFQPGEDRIAVSV